MSRIAVHDCCGTACTVCRETVPQTTERALRTLPPQYLSRAPVHQQRKAEVDRNVSDLNYLVDDGGNPEKRQILDELRRLEDQRNRLSSDALGTDFASIEARDRLRDLEHQKNHLLDSLNLINQEADEFGNSLRDLDMRGSSLRGTLKEVSADESDAQRRLRALNAEKDRLNDQLKRVVGEEAALVDRVGNLGAHRIALSNDLQNLDRDRDLYTSGLQDLENKNNEVGGALNALSNEEQEYARRLNDLGNQQGRLKNALGDVDRQINDNKSRLSANNPACRLCDAGIAHTTHQGAGAYAPPPPSSYNASPPPASYGYGGAGASPRGTSQPQYRAEPAYARQEEPYYGRDPVDRNTTFNMPNGAGRTLEPTMQQRPVDGVVPNRQSSFPRTTYQHDFTQRRDQYSASYY